MKVEKIQEIIIIKSNKQTEREREGEGFVTCLNRRTTKRVAAGCEKGRDQRQRGGVVEKKTRWKNKSEKKASYYYEIITL